MVVLYLAFLRACQGRQGSRHMFEGVIPCAIICETRPMFESSCSSQPHLYICVVSLNKTTLYQLLDQARASLLPHGVASHGTLV